MALKIKEHGTTKHFTSKACILFSPMDFCKLYELKIKPLILQKYLVRFDQKKTDKSCLETGLYHTTLSLVFFRTEPNVYNFSELMPSMNRKKSVNLNLNFQLF